MKLRIFTLPFDDQTESFPDEVVTEFCMNKKVHQIHSQFFLQEGRPFWSVAVHYDMLDKGEEKVRMLNESQQKLFEELKVWRREKSDKEGLPAYMIATNNQLSEMIKAKMETLESLKGVKGFGKQRIAKYGKEIVNVIKAFYDKEGVTDF